MKKQNEFISFIEEKTSFTPDYNDIKNKIIDPYFLKKEVKKINIRRYLKLAVYTLVVCVISICTTIIIQDAHKFGGITDISPIKANEEYLTNQFDSFFAFGSASPSDLFTFDIVFSSNIISEEDKEKIQVDKKNKKFNNYCNLYFGTKEGSDIVHIIQLGAPYKVYTFKSNLDYSFNDVIEKFEKTNNINIDNEYLISSSYDYILNRETAGITISFKMDDDVYKPYYTMILNGKVYMFDE